MFFTTLNSHRMWHKAAFTEVQNVQSGVSHFPGQKNIRRYCSFNNTVGRGRYPNSDPLTLKSYNAFTVDAVLMKTSLHETADIFLRVCSLISFTCAFIWKANEISQAFAKTLMGNLSPICDRETVDTWQTLPSVSAVLIELEKQFRNSHMEHKLKKPLIYNFKATDPQIAYLTPASEALIMNTSAIIGTQRAKPYARTKEFRMSSIESEDSRIF